jgi:phospholipase C
MANHLSDIEHVVVLMLENRAFDHLLGYMKAQGTKPGIDGLTGTEAIPADPTVSGSPLVPVSATAGNAHPDPDAGHELPDVSEQLYGHEDLSFPAGGLNNGFVVNYKDQSPAPASAADIMRCVDPSDPQRIPALATLARRFCVANRWYASMPGPTWPNRLFAHAATSGGHVTNDLGLYFLPNIFNRLDTAGLAWRIYYHDIPQSLLFFSLWDDFLLQLFTKRFRQFSSWTAGLSGSTCRLPPYTFIEPQYFSWTNPITGTVVHANDQHPSHPIAAADRLVRSVYRRLRNSRCWRHSVLVIVHDEHGGTYDHRFPSHPAINPDGLVSADPPFDFTRYGVRVPAVIVSPWASDGVCNDVHDHTSILATLEKRFGLAPLTARDAAANTLEGCLTAAALRLSAAQAPRNLPRAAMALSARERLVTRPGRRPLSSYQRALVQLALQIHLPPQSRRRALRRVSIERIRTEEQGARVVRARMAVLERHARAGGGGGGARGRGSRRVRPRKR